MPLARYIKTSVERKRYEIDYSGWLDTAETISQVEFATNTPATAVQTSPLYVDASSISEDGLSIVFFASFGDDGVTYQLDVRITTSGGQYKEDTITFQVRDP